MEMAYYFFPKSLSWESTLQKKRKSPLHLERERV
jgi:hypothetical protein